MAIETTPITTGSLTEEDAAAPRLPGQAPVVLPDPAEPSAEPSAERSAQALAPTPVRVVAGRYRLLRHVGRGGNGSVFQAEDQLTGQQVAVKLMKQPSGRALERIRGEVTALRWLRLPGVVRLLDDGLDQGDYFLVMELVSGRSFLGSGPFRWWEIAEPVRELLEVLARVHLAGVLHRDLKPQNILLTDDGHPVLVDFGIAKGRALSDEGGEGSGTVRYVAPEQAQAQPCGVQADLYALGVMLYEALSGGRLPQTASGRRALLRQRAYEDPRPLRDVAPFAPPQVAAVVDRLVARDPADRPASALDVLELLGGRPPAVLDGGLQQLLPADRPARARELWELFEGPDHFLHLREDAAAVLHLRTGGHADLVADELALWVQAGLASWKTVDDRELIAVDRVAIERLRTGEALAVGRLPPAHLSTDARRLLTWLRRAWPDSHTELLDAVVGGKRMGAEQELIAARLAWSLDDGRLGVRPVALPLDQPAERGAQRRLAGLLPDDSEARLRHLVAAGAPPESVLVAALAVVGGLLLEGRHTRVMAVLELGLLLARSHDGLELYEEALLTIWAKVAMAQESRAAAERALYEVGRAHVRSPGLARVEKLLVAWRLAVVFEAERAWEVAEELGGFADDELECWRVAAMDNAAARLGFQGRFLEGLAGWESQGRDPGLRRAKRAGWLGNLAYRESRFEDAVRWQRVAVEGKKALDGRVAARLNLASALLEAGRLDEAEAEALQASEEARLLRHGAYAAQSTYFQASARYRAERDVELSVDQLRAAGVVHVRWRAALSILAAAVAARDRHNDTALTLARQAAVGFTTIRAGDAAVLCSALALCLAGRAGTMIDEPLLAAARTIRSPGVQTQTLALLRWAAGTLAPEFLAEERAAQAAWPESDAARRRELLSLRECQAPFPPWRTP